MAIAINEEIYGTTSIDKYSNLAVSIKKTRIIFRCKNKSCKHTWAKEYRKVFSQMAATIWPRTGYKPYIVEARFEYIRIEGGKAINAEHDHNCPDCGRRGESSIVIGVLNEQHKCDARCMGAKTGACECSCGGQNHGINHL